MRDFTDETLIPQLTAVDAPHGGFAARILGTDGRLVAEVYGANEAQAVATAIQLASRWTGVKLACLALAESDDDATTLENLRRILHAAALP